MSTKNHIVKIGKRSVELTHEDKILFPKDKITKSDLIAYYQHIAPVMLPYMKNRAISLVRHPDGISKKGFFQKNIADYYPDWIEWVKVSKEAGFNKNVLCNNAATLVYLANQACITFHVWLSTIKKLNYPDRIVFDLDPATDKDFNRVKKTALELKEIIESLGLVPFAMVTGSRGMHITIPIKPEYDFDHVRAFARSVADFLVQRDPKNLTTEIRLAKRKGRIFIDVARNAYAQTSVAPYSVRAKPGAPVATPVMWDEVAVKKLTPNQFTIKNIFARLKKIGDPWKNIKRSARSLDGAIKKLASLN